MSNINDISSLDQTLAQDHPSVTDNNDNLDTSRLSDTTKGRINNVSFAVPALTTEPSMDQTRSLNLTNVEESLDNLPNIPSFEDFFNECVYRFSDESIFRQFVVKSVGIWVIGLLSCHNIFSLPT